MKYLHSITSPLLSLISWMSWNLNRILECSMKQANKQPTNICNPISDSRVINASSLSSSLQRLANELFKHSGFWRQIRSCRCTWCGKEMRSILLLTCCGVPSSTLPSGSSLVGLRRREKLSSRLLETMAKYLGLRGLISAHQNRSNPIRSVVYSATTSFFI